MNLPITFAVAALAISITHGLAVGEEAPKLRNIRIVPESVDFKDNLDGVSEWELGKGVTLSLRMNGDATEFVGADGKVLHSLKSPEFVRHRWGRSRLTSITASGSQITDNDGDFRDG